MSAAGVIRSGVDRAVSVSSRGSMAPFASASRHHRSGVPRWTAARLSRRSPSITVASVLVGEAVGPGNEASLEYGTGGVLARAVERVELDAGVAAGRAEAGGGQDAGVEQGRGSGRSARSASRHVRSPSSPSAERAPDGALAARPSLLRR